VGVQSFQHQNLAFLGRIHTRDQAIQSIRWAQDAGFENIGLDLIYGLPGQTQHDWQADLTQALFYDPAHLSCYLLTYEPQTPLWRQQQTGGLTPLDEQATADLFQLTGRYLTAVGYDHYEISNFARDSSRRSQHNLKYWRQVPYLGFGPAAHSYIHPERRWNTSNLTDYIHRLKTGLSAVDQRENLTKSQQMLETIYLGLRQTRGLCLAAFQQTYGRSFLTTFPNIIKMLASEGLLEISEHHCWLTSRGRLFHDHICGQLAAEMA
jgi:oxygen-independent coproporphyrinogen-3 oxidase